MALFKTRGVITGDSTDLDLLPASLRPGTMFWNTTNKQLYVLDPDGTWYGVSKFEIGETESDYEYHIGV